MTKEIEKTELSQESQIDDLLDGLIPRDEDSTKGEAETELDNKSDEEGEESETEGEVDVSKELEEIEEDEGGEKKTKDVEESIEKTVEEEAEEITGDKEEEVVSDREKMLLARIEELSAAKPMTAAEEAVEDAIASFISEEDDIDDIVSNKAKLNALLVKVSEATKTSVTKSILKSIPQIIVSQVQKQKVINDAVDEFYTENEDLVPVKRTVGLVANEVAAEHPDWDLAKVFKETGIRTRKVLGLKEAAIKKKKVIRNPAIPRSPRSGGRDGRTSKTDLNEMEKDIQDLIT